MRNLSSSLLVPAAMLGALAACHPTSQSENSGGSGGAMSGTSSDNSTSSDSSGAGGAAPVRAFKLVGAHWTGNYEAVDLIDPVTGSATFIANLAGLIWWSNQLVLNGDATYVYAVGKDSDSGPTTLYKFELATGYTGWATLDHDYALGGVTDDGLLIGAFWNGVTEEVDLIDPKFGMTTSVGTLGDLQFWSDQLSYDRDAHVVHAIGRDPANATQLYSLSLDTHVSTKVAVPNNYFLGGVTATGGLLGAYWDGSDERVHEVTPATGLGADQGQLGDLHTWSNGGFTFDVTTGRAYASGNTDMNVKKIYTLDLGSKAVTEVTMMHSYVLARQ